MATVAILQAEFPDAISTPFPPHLSLCQPFATRSNPAVVVGAIEGALCGAAMGDVRAEALQSFEGTDGAPEVLYLSVDSPWLHDFHRGLVHAVSPYRDVDEMRYPPSGNPAFELDGYTPHITLLLLREPAVPPMTRARIAERAQELWARVQPPYTTFSAREVTLSFRELDETAGDAVGAAGSVIHRWPLEAQKPAVIPGR